MSINVNLNDMENMKEDLMSFKKWLFFETLIEIPVEQIDKYIDTLNLRPREPRAVNRNEQAKELCFNCLHSEVDLFDEPCRNCNYKTGWEKRND